MTNDKGQRTVDKPLGNIITFYSYKGGTGRSMAVANVAWILASSGKRVLTVDWDLEAPGLHRYYAPFLSDKDLTGSEGLIDLLIEFRDATAISHDGAGKANWHEAYADVSAYVVSLDWDFPGGGTLDLLPAGRQGASYSARVNSFDWEEFYERRGGGVFLEAVKERMRADYDYVLIDSRTGVSDTSGICTVQMPDAVVVCFTLNNQGVKGSAAVAHSIYEQRLRKGREIAIFPVLMRVEPFEKTKLDLRREYAKELFKLFPSHLAPQSRAQFQEDTQVKYLPYYAYEEILATFGNRPGEADSTSLLAPAERLTAYLTDYLPGEQISRMEASESLESRRQSVLALFEGKQGAADLSQLLIQSADAAWAGLRPEEEKVARRALLRLVRVAEAGEQGGDTRLLLRLSKFDRAAQSVLHNLGATPLVTIERDTAPGEAVVQLSSDDLLRYWPRLQSWIREDREFLLWRQNLNLVIAEWRRLNEDNGALLAGAPLELAKSWQAGRAEDLNENETVYINRCVAEEERRIREQIEREEQVKQQAAEREDLIKKSQKSLRRSRLRAITAYAVALLVLATIVWWQYKKQQQERINEELARKAAYATNEGDGERAKNDFDKALIKYNEAIGLNRSYALAYYGRGRVYLERRQLDDALRDFDEVIKLNANDAPASVAPNANDPLIASNADAYVGRGDVYWLKRDFDNAIEAYSRAIKLKPDLPDAHVKRGKVLVEKGNRGDAMADYNRAIELSKDNPLAFLWRGTAYSASGDNDLALEDFDRALNLKPDLSEAYIKRAEVLLKRGGARNSEQAINDYNKGLRDPSYDPKPYLDRGDAYKNTGKVQLAIADFERVIKLSQDKPEYSKIKADASEQLRKLAPPTALYQGISQETTKTTPTIYLHSRDQNDEAALKRIAVEIRKQSDYKVARGFQLVTQATTGDVRYFHQEDEANAAKVKEIVERTLKARGVEKTLELKPFLRLGQIKDVPRGWIEVWLPPLPEPSLNIQRPLERTPYQYRPKPQAQ
jgi:tetratricopeptide (TPR) repeat protein/MinD-like ATPase involved in chromosome partitioning or flagellar assembly